MSMIDAFAELQAETTGWRRDLHANPELLYDVHRTAAFVAGKLRDFGCDEIITCVGRTGVVGIIRGKADSTGRVIGLRADMDALPIQETTGLPYASKIPGRMHACGHDGHTAMLLGAAKRLATTRNFGGTAVVVFQPAEEGGAGAKAMCDDGLMTRFGIQEVYAMHTEPGLPIGQFATAAGPLGASADGFRIIIEGKATHGADPHTGIDPLVAAANILLALQTIIARNLDPMKCGVVSVGALNGGKAGSAVPQTAEMVGTVRSFEPEVRDLLQKRVTKIAENVAAAYGAVATVHYKRMYPPTVNHAPQTEFAVGVARSLVGDDNVEANRKPLMGSEDFAFMLEERPGNIMLIGNGNSAGVHDPKFDFNDDAIPFGVAYLVGLIEAGTLVRAADQAS
jgi:amidohydrolase